MGKRNIAKELEEFGVIEAFKGTDRNFRLLNVKLENLNQRVTMLEKKASQRNSGILGAGGTAIPKT